jgi:hypothetical protein
MPFGPAPPTAEDERDDASFALGHDRPRPPLGVGFAMWVLANTRASAGPTRE